MHTGSEGIGKSGILDTSPLSVTLFPYYYLMSQTTKLVLGIAVAVVVLGGAYYYWQQTHGPSSSEEQTEVTTLPTGTDKSDNSLEKDLSSIDAQIQAVANDNTNAAASVQAASAQ